MTKKTLITSFNTKYNTAPFRIIQTEDFLPAFKETIKMAKKEIDTIVINPKKQEEVLFSEPKDKTHIVIVVPI